jgi:hypothetical protein
VMAKVYDSHLFTVDRRHCPWGATSLAHSSLTANTNVALAACECAQDARHLRRVAVQTRTLAGQLASRRPRR